LAAAIATPFMPDPWRIAAAIAQILAYGLALADSALPQDASVKRLTSPARTFVVLMVASLFAVVVFFVPPRVLWGQTRVSQSAAAR
jgi:hypothetical protein